jgi:hypothetical protein
MVLYLLLVVFARPGKKQPTKDENPRDAQVLILYVFAQPCISCA